MCSFLSFFLFFSFSISLSKNVFPLFSFFFYILYFPLSMSLNCLNIYNFLLTTFKPTPFLFCRFSFSHSLITCHKGCLHGDEQCSSMFSMSNTAQRKCEQGTIKHCKKCITAMVLILDGNSQIRLRTHEEK